MTADHSTLDFRDIDYVSIKISLPSIKDFFPHMVTLTHQTTTTIVKDKRLEDRQLLWITAFPLPSMVLPFVTNEALVRKREKIIEALRTHRQDVRVGNSNALVSRYGTVVDVHTLAASLEAAEVQHVYLFEFGMKALVSNNLSWIEKLDDASILGGASDNVVDVAASYMTDKIVLFRVPRKSRVRVGEDGQDREMSVSTFPILFPFRDGPGTVLSSATMLDGSTVKMKIYSLVGAPLSKAIPGFGKPPRSVADLVAHLRYLEELRDLFVREGQRYVGFRIECTLTFASLRTLLADTEEFFAPNFGSLAEGRTSGFLPDRFDFIRESDRESVEFYVVEPRDFLSAIDRATSQLERVISTVKFWTRSGVVVADWYLKACLYSVACVVGYNNKLYNSSRSLVSERHGGNIRAVPWDVVAHLPVEALLARWTEHMELLLWLFRQTHFRPTVIYTGESERREVAARVTFKWERLGGNRALTIVTLTLDNQNRLTEGILTIGGEPVVLGRNRQAPREEDSEASANFVAQCIPEACEILRGLPNWRSVVKYDISKTFEARVSDEVHNVRLMSPVVETQSQTVGGAVYKALNVPFVHRRIVLDVLRLFERLPSLAVEWVGEALPLPFHLQSAYHDIEYDSGGQRRGPQAYWAEVTRRRNQNDLDAEAVWFLQKIASIKALLFDVQVGVRVHIFSLPLQPALVITPSPDSFWPLIDVVQCQTGDLSEHGELSQDGTWYTQWRAFPSPDDAQTSPVGGFVEASGQLTFYEVASRMSGNLWTAQGLEGKVLDELLRRRGDVWTLFKRAYDTESNTEGSLVYRRDIESYIGFLRESRSPPATYSLLILLSEYIGQADLRVWVCGGAERPRLFFKHSFLTTESVDVREMQWDGRTFFREASYRLLSYTTRGDLDQ